MGDNDIGKPNQGVHLFRVAASFIGCPHETDPAMWGLLPPPPILGIFVCDGLDISASVADGGRPDWQRRSS